MQTTSLLPTDTQAAKQTHCRVVSGPIHMGWWQLDAELLHIKQNRVCCVLYPDSDLLTAHSESVKQIGLERVGILLPQMPPREVRAIWHDVEQNAYDVVMLPYFIFKNMPDAALNAVNQIMIQQPDSFNLEGPKHRHLSLDHIPWLFMTSPLTPDIQNWFAHKMRQELGVEPVFTCQRFPKENKFSIVAEPVWTGYQKWRRLRLAQSQLKENEAFLVIVQNSEEEQFIRDRLAQDADDTVIISPLKTLPAVLSKMEDAPSITLFYWTMPLHLGWVSGLMHTEKNIRVLLPSTREDYQLKKQYCKNRFEDSRTRKAALKALKEVRNYAVQTRHCHHNRLIQTFLSNQYSNSNCKQCRACQLNDTILPGDSATDGQPSSTWSNIWRWIRYEAIHRI